MEFKIYDGDLRVNVELTSEKSKKIFDRIIQFCKDQNCISGESLMQSDSSLIEAPEVLSDILDDIMDFKEEWI